MAQIYASNHLSAGALTQTHWGSLHRSPRPPSWFRGGAHGEREGGRGGGKEGGEGREGNGREGRGGCPGMPKSRVGKPNLTATSDVNTGICFPVVLIVSCTNQNLSSRILHLQLKLPNALVCVMIVNSVNCVQIPPVTLHFATKWSGP